MAYVQFENGLQEVNLSRSVGSGGANLKDDVIVVQAMLKYALREKPYFKGTAFSEPNGPMDLNTENVIKRYQLYLRKVNGSQVSVDGRIDPAKDRPSHGNSGMWTIRQLSRDALEWWVLSCAPNYNWVYDMYLTYPVLRQAIPDPPVETLNLRLAGSSNRVVETLRLELI